MKIDAITASLRPTADTLQMRKVIIGMSSVTFLLDLSMVTQKMSQASKAMCYVVLVFTSCIVLWELGRSIASLMADPIGHYAPEALRASNVSGRDQEHATTMPIVLERS